jgi:hypothetical protein
MDHSSDAQVIAIQARLDHLNLQFYEWLKSTPHLPQDESADFFLNLPERNDYLGRYEKTWLRRWSREVEHVGRQMEFRLAALSEIAKQCERSATYADVGDF